MSFTPYRRGTVLAPSGPCSHLHIICNDPVYHPEYGCYCVLAVNISSVPRHGIPYDTTCVFSGGEHAFIRHPSYVFYAKAVIWRVPALENRLAEGTITTHQDLAEVHFQKVIAGFQTSRFVPGKFRKFAQKYCS